MKKYLVAVLVIASLSATVTNALELKNAVVLDQKTSISHGLSGGFVETGHR
ncbi:MAG: hypothetical protein ABI597_00700 [Gammaproteobacteria bacterium]